MERTNMFGKTYNTIGSTDSNFIIKTSGDLKILWRNKFIDVVKDGKIASSGANLLKEIDSVEDIFKDGIYLIKSEDGDLIWLSINGTKVNLVGEVGTTYVSFLAQQDANSDLKYMALSNAGFYYETLQDAINAGVKAGLVYIPNEKKLYIANNGNFTDYYLEQLPNVAGNEFNEIIIGDLRIYTNEDNSVFGTSKNNIQIIIEDKRYVTFGKDKILAELNLEMDINTIIQSIGANENRGYRLYDAIGGSVLEVDNLIWRNKPDTETLLVEDFDILNNRNVILYAESVYENGETIIGNTLCTLKYVHTFKKDDWVYLFLRRKPEELPVLSISENLITLSNAAEELIDLRILYDDGQESFVSIFPGNTEVSFTPLSVIARVEIVSEFNSILVTGNDPVTKAFVLEKKIIAILGQLILLDLDKSLLNYLQDVIICTMNSPLIQIDENTMYILDRTEEIEKEDGTKEWDKTIHSQLGVLSEEEIEFLKPPKDPPMEYPPEVEEVKLATGIYSDNFIGINSKMYDCIFKKKLFYPSYDKEIALPEKITTEKKYDYVVPDIRWIKDLMKLFIPPGTIVMYNGLEELPDGWVICDGNNGTPNLIGKFIKAGTEVGENEVDPNLDENNIIKLKEEHLPKHYHPHSHTGSTDTGHTDYVSVLIGTKSINAGGEEAVDVNTISSMLTSDSHRHEIYTDDTTYVEKEWPNNGIKIEPRAYSLIFIMKVYLEEY